MKKYNEGYALPFVLVVSVVMCIIATTVMTFSLNNLQSQQKTIERMQAKYDASSLVEEIFAATKVTNSVVIELDGERDNVTIGDTTVKIETIGTSNNGEVEVLLVAEIELVDSNSGTVVKVIGFSKEENELTISYCGNLRYKSYTCSVMAGEGATS